MYEPGTILTLKVQRGTEEEPFAYDRVEVVGASPIQTQLQGAEWVGAEGAGVIVKPAPAYVEFDPADYEEGGPLEGQTPPPSPFGSSLDEPYGKLKDLYDVESIPVHEAPAAQPVKIINQTSGSAGATPEEQFAEAAKEQEGDRRFVPTEDGGRAARSPLDGPLSDEERQAVEAKRAQIEARTPVRGAEEEVAPEATE